MTVARSFSGTSSTTSCPLMKEGTMLFPNPIYDHNKSSQVTVENDKNTSKDPSSGSSIVSASVSSSKCDAFTTNLATSQGHSQSCPTKAGLSPTMKPALTLPAVLPLPAFLRTPGTLDNAINAQSNDDNPNSLGSTIATQISLHQPMQVSMEQTGSLSSLVGTSTHTHVIDTSPATILLPHNALLGSATEAAASTIHSGGAPGAAASLCPSTPVSHLQTNNYQTQSHPFRQLIQHPSQDQQQLLSPTTKTTPTTSQWMAKVPPIRKLSSRSIVSLPSLSNDCTKSIATSNDMPRSNAVFNITSHQTPKHPQASLFHSLVMPSSVVATQFPPSNFLPVTNTEPLSNSSESSTKRNIDKLQAKIPTAQQVQNRKHSSYSAASNATIAAQQNFQNNGQHSQIQHINSQESAVQTTAANAVSFSTTNSSLNTLQGRTSLQQSLSQPLHHRSNNTFATKNASTSISGKKRLASGESQPHNQVHKYQKVVGGKNPSTTSTDVPMSPQAYLKSLFQSRGYSTQNYCSLEGGYYCKPTPLQKASYGMKLIQAVRSSNKSLLTKLLKCGLSSNPCNAFGESIIHMVCRRGDFDLLKIFIDHGCSLQVSDDFGRTPLHDACWTANPCFRSIELILNRDRRLLHIVDCRGAPPLSYVKRENYKKWVDFLESKKDVYWKPRNITQDGEEPPPSLSMVPPHSRPIADPDDEINLENVKLVSSGEIEPEMIYKLKVSSKKNILVADAAISTSEEVVQAAAISTA